ncbi:MAG: hypothetical protein M5R41_04825 [Bacteroidia bacterium]|nr:hypothetical protein [Bacteroidia bacterium]
MTKYPSYRRYAFPALWLLLTVASFTASAQKVTYSWSPDEMLVIGAGGGLTKYFGEFTDQNFGGAAHFHVKYFFMPEVALQVDGGFGKYVYNRRLRDEFKDAYTRQFYKDPRLLGLTEFPGGDFSVFADDPAMRHQVMETDKLLFGEVRGLVNLFPRSRLNVYISTGLGMMRYENSNIERTLPDGSPLLNVTLGDETYSVDTPTGVKQGISTLSEGANTLPVIPVGFGFDLLLTDAIALNLDLSYRFLLGSGNDMMDGFGVDVQEMFNTAGRVDRTRSTENADSWGSMTFGVQVYLFGHKDRDGDGLSDTYEAGTGTDPLNPDTDGDGLTDWEEVYSYRTDPLKTDTDEDRLTDAEEIAKKTDPLNPDTDNDGLKDGEELAHGTDPFDGDTDKDGLKDGDEVHTHKSSPLRIDTDSDGLDDYAEIMRHKTDPRLADSDRDGLADAKELELGTDPANPDSDGDGLDDGAEVNQYKTNPLQPDSDNDGVTDGDEVRAGANPTVLDSDGDGIHDGKDLCPGKPEIINGYRDSDGCPDVVPLIIEPRVGLSAPLRGVEFSEDGVKLLGDVGTQFAPLQQMLSDNPSTAIEITVTLSGKPGDMQQRLAQIRAEAIVLYLTGKGVAPERLKASGKSARNPGDMVTISIIRE